MDLEKIRKAREAAKLKQEQAAKEAQQSQADSLNTSRLERQIVVQAEKSRKNTQKVEIVNQPKLEIEHTTDFKPLENKLDEVINHLDKLPAGIKIPAQEKTESVAVTNLIDYGKELKEILSAVKAIKLDPQVNVAAPSVTIPKTEIDTKGVIAKLDDVLKQLKKTPAQLDLSPLEAATKSVKDAINGLSFPVPNYVLPFSKDGKATQVVLNSDGSLPITASISTGSLATAANQTSGTQLTQIVDAGGEVATVTGGKLDVNATASLAGSALPIASATTGVGVAILDSSGNQISTFGGGTEYTEDAAAAANPTGGMLITRRKDTLSATEVSADGDNIAVNATAKGEVYVKHTDAIPITDNSGSLTVDGTVASSNLPTTVDTNSGVKSASTLRVVLATDQPALTNKLLVTPDLPSGASTAAKQPALGTAGAASADVLTVQGIASMTALKVDGSGVTQPVSGTVTAAAQPGVDIGDVTINNAAGASAVNIQDGGNSITIDGSVSISGTPVVDTELTTADLDTGAGTDTRAVVGLVGSKSGGGVLIPGDATKGLAVDLTATGANTTALKVDGSAVTQPVSLASVPSHAVTNAGTFAVQASEADGANVTLGAKADAKSTATDTTAVTIMSVLKQISASVQAPPSQAVTNAGTFVVQATLSAETTKVIGVVRTADGSGNLLTSTSNALDVNLKTSAATNISTNLAQVNGVTTLAGNGASGTGAQRVTIASDSTGQTAPAANATATGALISYTAALVATKVAVNAAAGNLYGFHIYNPNTVVIYVQLFNVASASVTLGTTAPTSVIVVPAGGWADSSYPVPITFGTALTVAATTTASGSTAPSTGLTANFWYK